MISKLINRLRDGLFPPKFPRVIVMLKTKTADAPPKGHQTPTQRQAAIDAVVQSAQRALPAVDAVLRRFGGRRISKKPDALGTIVVETTPEGMEALKALESVDGVVEDRPVTLIR